MLEEAKKDSDKFQGKLILQLKYINKVQTASLAAMLKIIVLSNFSTSSCLGAIEFELTLHVEGPGFDSSRG